MKVFLMAVGSCPKPYIHIWKNVLKERLSDGNKVNCLLLFSDVRKKKSMGKFGEIEMNA